MSGSLTCTKCVNFISGKLAKGKAYQVNQVLRAIEKLEVDHGVKE